MSSLRIVDLIHNLEGDWKKVVKLEGDRGGYTQGGVSSRAYPHLASRIKAGQLSLEEIKGIFEEDYYKQVAGFEELEVLSPEILALLFFGRVHGSGDEHYTELIQYWINNGGLSSNRLEEDGIWGTQTATAVINLTTEDRHQLWLFLENHVKDLAVRRANSVNSRLLVRQSEIG